MQYEINENRRHRDMMHSAYTGRPTAENNYAWEDLIRRKSDLLHEVTLLHQNSTTFQCDGRGNGHGE
jgi:hypothetical protein